MRSRLSPPGVAGIALLAAFTLFITWRAKSLETEKQESAETPALVNKPAPDFSLPALDGSTVSLANFHGKKKVVVTFWASWCGPCRMEMPGLRQFYERQRKHSDRFELLAISIDDTRKPAEDYATSMKLPFPVLLDSGRKTADAYGVTAIPTLFVIDENGKVIYGHTGVEQAMEFILAARLGLKLENATGGSGQ
jgi:peroxiredoxin